MSVITDIVAGVAGPVKDLLSEFITDKDKAAEIAYKVSTMAAEHAHTETLAQLEVNKTEAATGSLFIGGWRPAMGWTCVAAYFLAYVGLPMMAFTAEIFGTHIDLPAINFMELAPVLFGMLGLGGLRTFEKAKGVAA